MMAKTKAPKHDAAWAAAQLEKMGELNAKADALMKKHKIVEIHAEAAAIKAEVTTWAIENEVEQIQLEDAHATLITQNYGGRWLATPDDITDEDPAGASSLQEIIEAKFKSDVAVKGSAARKVWMRITKRVIDQVELDNVVHDDVLTPDEIAPAYVEKTKKPFLRVFSDVD